MSSDEKQLIYFHSKQSPIDEYKSDYENMPNLKNN